MPTSTAITASAGTWCDSAANNAADATPRPRSSVVRRAFSACQIARRAATSARWSTAFDAATRRGDLEDAARGRDRRCRRAPAPSPGGSGRARRARCRPARSACTARCRCGSANDAPNTSRRSDSFISHDATGVPLRPSTPAAERVVVGDEALRLERGGDRRAEQLGEPHDGVDAGARAVPDDDHRPLRPVTSSDRAWSTASSGGRDRGVGQASARRAGCGVARGQCLHLVGQHEVRDAALYERVLAGQAHQLGVVGVALHGLATRPRRRRTPRSRSRSWNAPRPRTFDGTCPEIASTGARSTLAS